MSRSLVMLRSTRICRVRMRRLYCVSTPAPVHGIILSGIQPTGVPHIGNYLGALRNWAALQDSGAERVIYSIVDLHALTAAPKAPDLRSGILCTLASLIACGVDPARSVIFQQSDVRQHAELAWILNCLTPLGWLDRMTQFKQKAADGKRVTASLGLYAYPVLQAADILLYRATAVPVGEDQMQHLELARDIATAFNVRYGEAFHEEHHDGQFFKLPVAVSADDLAGASFVGTHARVMSLRDAMKKMSKSDRSPAGRIDLTDDADAISRKVRKAKTDNLGTVPSDLEACSERPEVRNLVGIYSALQDLTVEQGFTELAGQDMRSLKEAVTSTMVAKIVPIGEEIVRLLADKAHLHSVLDKGASVASEAAENTMVSVRESIGIRSR